MAWGDPRKLTKEELKEAGLDADVITTKLASLDGLDDRIKNAAVEANKGTAATLEELKTQLGQLASKFTAAPPKAGDNGGGGGNGNNNDEEEIDWVLDPQKAAEKLVNSKVGGVAQLAAQMRSDMNYTSFKSTNPRGFSEYEKEIKEMWDKEPLTAKLNPKMIENIYKIVIAGHMEEIVKKGETFFLEPSTNGGGQGRSDRAPRKAEEILTKDELELATKWGVTPDEYLKEKSGVTGVTYA